MGSYRGEPDDLLLYPRIATGIVFGFVILCLIYSSYKSSDSQAQEHLEKGRRMREADRKFEGPTPSEESAIEQAAEGFAEGLAQKFTYQDGYNNYYKDFLNEALDAAIKVNRTHKFTLHDIATRQDQANVRSICEECEGWLQYETATIALAVLESQTGDEEFIDNFKSAIFSSFVASIYSA